MMDSTMEDLTSVQTNGAVEMEDVRVAAERGPMRMVLARPDGPGPFVPVIMFPHVGGLTDTMCTMARIAAGGGYLCAVVDAYHRLGSIVIDPQSDDADVVAIRRIAASSVTVKGAMADARSAMTYLRARKDVIGTAFGTIGYGRGGSLALRAAASFPERVGAAVSILGFGFTEEGVDGVRSWLDGIRAGIYCAFAECDDIIPANVADELKALLDGRPDTRVVIHPGARHPYAFPDRTVHDPRAAQSDWEAIFALWARRLAGRS
jgi:carboxymethylenebutenolidase